MDKNLVILKLFQNRIWFNDILSIEMTSANLPGGALKIMPSHPVFWLLEQVSYKKDICCLEVKVVDFFLRDVISFSNQKPKAPIHSITFLNLPNDEDLRMALRYYSHRMNDLDKAMEAGYNEFKGIDDRSEKRVAKKNLLFRSYEETSRLEVSFDVWFKETQFKLGYIAFDNDIKELKQIF